MKMCPKIGKKRDGNPSKKRQQKATPIKNTPNGRRCWQLDCKYTL